MILIFANGAQMTRLIHASTWKSGERIVVRTAAEAGTCGEGIAATYLLKRPTIAFPCYGTRRFGLAMDDEIIFAIPSQGMDELLEGLEKTHRAMPYPILQQVEFPLGLPLFHQERAISQVSFEVSLVGDIASGFKT